MRSLYSFTYASWYYMTMNERIWMSHFASRTTLWGVMCEYEVTLLIYICVMMYCVTWLCMSEYEWVMSHNLNTNESIHTCYGIPQWHSWGMPKIIGLFCKRALQKRRYSAKETCNIIDPTNSSHSTLLYAITIPPWHSWGMPKIIGLFCKSALQKRRYSAKEMP